MDETKKNEQLVVQESALRAGGGEGGGDEPAVSPVNVQVGLGFTLLGTDLTAAFEKTAEGFQVLIMPKDGKVSEGMTIKKMIDDIQEMLKGTDAKISDEEKAKMTSDISAAVDNVKDDTPNAVNALDPTSIRINLRQAFLYLVKKTGAASSTSVEYAFSLSVDMSQLIPKGIEIARIDDVFLSVWNTNRPKILERMQLGSIDALLK